MCHPVSRALPLSCMLLSIASCSRVWASTSAKQASTSRAPTPHQEAEGASTYYPARVPGALQAHPELAVQVDDGIVDEGKDSQLELGFAGVAILDHTGVGVGDRAAGGGNTAPEGSCSSWLLLGHASCEHLPFTGIHSLHGSLRGYRLIWPQAQTA